MQRLTEAPGKDEICFARAVLYRLCAQSFRHPDEAWLAEWKAIARGVASAIEVLAADGGSPELCSAFDLLYAATVDPAKIRAEHGRLFGHTPRAGVTPYETEWTGSPGELRQYHALSDISAFYQAHGLELARACGERHDHLAVELGFQSFLCVKEAYGLERGPEELTESSRQAQKAFLAEHVASWIPSFCVRLERAGRDGFYGRAARFLRTFIESEDVRLGVAPAELDVSLPDSSVSLEECCAGCDLARTCAPLSGREP
jgi:TorA maturation chaperone TorD